MSDLARNCRRYARHAAATVAICSAVVVAGGCSRTDDSVGAGFIPPEESERSLQRILLEQAAAGAETDRTFYDDHFDGASLNSLGEHKLELLLASTAFLKSPAIYVATDDPGHTDAVRDRLAALDLGPDEVPVLDAAEAPTRKPAAVRAAQRQAMGGAGAGTPAAGTGTGQ